MKKSTKNLIVGFLVSLAIFVIFLIYKLYKNGTVERSQVHCFLVYIIVYLVTGILLNKFGGRD